MDTDLKDIEFNSDGEEYGRVDGIIRKISIGADIRQRVVEAIGGGSEKSFKVTRISFDTKFLEKHGRVRAFIFTKVGEDEKIWKQLIDNTIIEYTISNQSTYVPKNTGKHTGNQSRSTARIATNTGQ